MKANTLVCFNEDLTQLWSETITGIQKINVYIAGNDPVIVGIAGNNLFSYCHENDAEPLNWTIDLGGAPQLDHLALDGNNLIYLPACPATPAEPPAPSLPAGTRVYNPNGTLKFILEGQSHKYAAIGKKRAYFAGQNGLIYVK